MGHQLPAVAYLWFGLPPVDTSEEAAVPDHALDPDRDPATSRFDMRFDDPRMNPIAFLPADPPGSISYGGVTDHVPLPGAPSGFIHDDGSVYARPDPDEFPSFDEVDSTTVDDQGAPE